MARRKVTKLTRQRAFATIKIVAKAMLNGENYIAYKDLAERLEMPNPTGRGLGPILDEAALMCKERNLPDVSSVIVTQSSIDAGKPFPSEDSFNSDGNWPLSGLHRSEVPRAQEQVASFAWKSVRELGLGD